MDKVAELRSIASDAEGWSHEYTATSACRQLFAFIAKRIRDVADNLEGHPKTDEELAGEGGLK